MRSPGVTVTAEHRVAEVDSGRCAVLLRVTFQGLLAPLAFLVARRLTREYIGREAEALRTTTEAERGAA